MQKVISSLFLLDHKELLNSKGALLYVDFGTKTTKNFKMQSNK
jgi:hypothetical protein